MHFTWRDIRCYCLALTWLMLLKAVMHYVHFAVMKQCLLIWGENQTGCSKSILMVLFQFLNTKDWATMWHCYCLTSVFFIYITWHFIQLLSFNPNTSPQQYQYIAFKYISMNWSTSMKTQMCDISKWMTLLHVGSETCSIKSYATRGF